MIMCKQTPYKKQSGAALIVGLLLLVVITVLAISGMNTGTTQLAMARNDQNYENAFQAAETGLETALGQGQFNTVAGTTVTQYINSYDQVTATIAYEDSTLVPDAAFSLGVGGGSVVAYHFLATATAVSERSPGITTDRDSSAIHTQAFYVVGPQAPTL
jgi:type IV pilus assembly protein PilX